MAVVWKAQMSFVVETFPADCPVCEARVSAEIIGTDAIFEENGRPEYRVCFVRCPGCGRGLLARQEYVDDNEWGHHEWSAAVRLWPLPDREAHHAIPAIVQVSLDEAHRCRRAGAYTACAVMCGRALEGICVHFGAKSMLAKGLADLRDRKIIDERLFDWGEQLRHHRNIGAHASITDHISREDATDLLEFVGAICDYIFVLSARFDAFMARKSKVKAAPVPPPLLGVPGQKA